MASHKLSDYTEDLRGYHVDGTWVFFLCTTVFSAKLACSCIWTTSIYLQNGDRQSNLGFAITITVSQTEHRVTLENEQRAHFATFNDFALTFGCLRQMHQIVQHRILPRRERLTLFYSVSGGFKRGRITLQSSYKQLASSAWIDLVIACNV